MAEFRRLDEVLTGKTGSRSGPSSFRKTVRTESLTCSRCKTVFQGEVKVYQYGESRREVRPSLCPACQAAEEAEQRRIEEQEARLQALKTKAKWREERSGIPEYLRGKNFGNYDRRFQRQVVKAIEEWAETFCRSGGPGCPSLLLYSEGYGVGKTHLAVAVANHVLDIWQVGPEYAACPVRFESGPGLVRRIRATYNVPLEQRDSHETEEMVYRQLRSVKLLILDDLGKEKPSDHTREVYFYLIDERMKLGLPVFITSNLPLEAEDDDDAPSLEPLIGEATVSRLVEMCRGHYYKLAGDDYRRKAKGARV